MQELLLPSRSQGGNAAALGSEQERHAAEAAEAAEAEAVEGEAGEAGEAEEAGQDALPPQPPTDAVQDRGLGWRGGPKLIGDERVTLRHSLSSPPPDSKVAAHHGLPDLSGAACLSAVLCRTDGSGFTLQSVSCTSPMIKTYIGLWCSASSASYHLCVSEAPRFMCNQGNLISSCS